MSVQTLCTVPKTPDPRSLLLRNSELFRMRAWTFVPFSPGSSGSMLYRRTGEQDRGNIQWVNYIQVPPFLNIGCYVPHQWFLLHLKPYTNPSVSSEQIYWQLPECISPLLFFFSFYVLSPCLSCPGVFPDCIQVFCFISLSSYTAVFYSCCKVLPMILCFCGLFNILWMFPFF